MDGCRNPLGWMQRVELDQVPVTIGIIGAQGGGKSTLLNKCFKSNFIILADANFPERTTTGVWVAIARDPRVLLVDVEGADAVAHVEAQSSTGEHQTGEHYQNPERKMALMTMVLSDGLIINISQKDISKASPYVLLKTIMGLKLELFRPDESSGSVTNLLFLVRDVPNMSDEDVKNGVLHPEVKKIVDEQVDKIWKDLRTGAPGKRFEDLFNLKLMGMPDLTNTDCIGGTNVLRCDAASENVIKWRDKIAASMTRPEWTADLWYKFLERVWKTISQEKELNLPDEKDLMFQFEFNKLTEAAFQNLQKQISECNSLEDILEITQQLLSDLHNNTKKFNWSKLTSALSDVANRVVTTVEPVLERCACKLAKQMASEHISALRGLCSSMLFLTRNATN